MYPRTNLVRYGQRSFGVIDPRTWNQFPSNIRDPSLSFNNFGRRLKTVLTVLGVLVRIRDEFNT